LFVVVQAVPGYLHIIENADATPPHLEVSPAFGKLSWDAWFFAVLCVWVAQLVDDFGVRASIFDQFYLPKASMMPLTPDSTYFLPM
jgi:hypothetical protein